MIFIFFNKVYEGVFRDIDENTSRVLILLQYLEEVKKVSKHMK